MTKLNKHRLGSTLCLGVAGLNVIAALLPILRGREMNAAPLGVAVVFFCVGIALRKSSAGDAGGTPPG